MKNKIILIVFLSVLITCKKSTEKNTTTKIEKNGFSITCPADWEISDDEKFDEGGYYLSIEKNGFDSSGLFTLSVIEDSLDLDYSIQFNIEELQSNLVYRNSTFEEITNNKFNSINTRSSSFKFGLVGIKHEGIIHAFYGKNKTYIVLKQEALEDKNDNLNGFNLIESSFLIK